MPVERIEPRIYLVRGQRVMLDRDLADLYGVKTFNLNKAVKRNLERFPADFMFRLTKEEYRSLRFQIGILKAGQHSKYLPLAFTEQGIAMLSGALHSHRAILVNIQIMRTFVKLKQILAGHKDLEQKLNLLEQKFGKHIETHDSETRAIFAAIKKLIAPPRKRARKIGFLADRNN